MISKNTTKLKSKLSKAIVTCSVVLFSAATFAAQPKVFQEEVIIDINQIKNDDSLTPKAKAEWLAQMGEIFVNPTGFMFADDILSEALAIDGSNQRALFYKAFLKPLMSLEGILKRIEPVMAKETEDVKKSYEEYAKVYLPNSGLQAFLLNGQPNIRNEADIQKYLDGLSAEQDGYRRYLKGNKDLVLTLHVSKVTKINSQQRKDMWNTCYSKETAKGIYVISPCKYMTRQSFKVERADVEVLQHIAAGLQMFTIMATSYDAKGTLVYSRAVRKGWSPTDKGAVGYFNKINEFGKLRSENTLDIVHGMASDVFAGAKWANKIQHSLCPAGKGTNNRPGHLISEGVCINDDDAGMSVDTIFRTVELALNAQTIDVFARDKKAHITAFEKDTSGAAYETQANLLAPILNPVSDLKDLMPTRFNNCGNATNVGESTLGGLFPHGDAQDFLTATGDLNRSCQ